LPTRDVKKTRTARASAWVKNSAFVRVALLDRGGQRHGAGSVTFDSFAVYRVKSRFDHPTLEFLESKNRKGAEAFKVRRLTGIGIVLHNYSGFLGFPSFVLDKRSMRVPRPMRML